MAKKTISASLDEKVIQYLKEEADRMGISVSGLIAVMVDVRMQQQAMPTMLNQLQNFVDELKATGAFVDDEKIEKGLGKSE